jgi:alpha-beta hydrolase superfamily lysophospholipase
LFRRFRLLLLSLTLVVGAGVLPGGCTPRFAPAGETIGPPRFALTPDAPGAFIAADGVRLPLRIWEPEGKLRTVVLALHGFNDYSNAFEAPARYWASRGILTYAYDQRGFGEGPHPGLWADTDALACDLAAAVALLRARHPGHPLYVLGDSMGGAVVLAAAASRCPLTGPARPDGAILVAPAVWGRQTQNVFLRASLWLAAHTVPWLRVTGRELRRVPSDNREMLEALSKDPRVIKRTRIDSIKGLVDLMTLAFEAAPELPLPALLLYGEKDEIVPEEAVRTMLERLADPVGSADLTYAFYENGYHMLLRDLGAEAVWKDVAAWMVEPEAPLPSGAEAGARAD